MKNEDIINKTVVSVYATIKNISNPFGDYYTVELIPDKHFNWLAGSYAKFTLINKEITGKNYRIFSMASIQEENILLLAFKTGKNISSFKKTLINMDKGERIKINGPFGGFKKHKDKNHIVLFASGVGIVPMRGFLKSLEDETRTIDIVFVSNDYHLFYDELKTFAKRDNAHLYAFEHRVETTAKLLELIKKYKNDAHYYICGSPHVLKQVQKNILENGVIKSNITYDPFEGY